MPRRLAEIEEMAGGTSSFSVAAIQVLKNRGLMVIVGPEGA